MAKTIARCYGGNANGDTGEVTRLGSRYAVGMAATYRTFAEVTVWADGSGTLEVKRDDVLLHRFAFDSESPRS